MTSADNPENTVPASSAASIMFEIVLACDLVAAAENTMFGLPEGTLAFAEKRPPVWRGQ